ncbi:hypothetical protein MKEN_00475100 [Mycena kentingensis (nom. inval.)]|nr:hypothetical protein MKEN_00475100 [Mycena kentingensis (nom. inval.)]
MKSHWYIMARKSSPERPNDEPKAAGIRRHLSLRRRLSTRQILSYILIVGFSVALIIAVVITGVLFNKSVTSLENKHSFSPEGLHQPPNAPHVPEDAPAMGLLLFFKNFDPASSVLSFDVSASFGQLDGDLPAPTEVCVFIADQEGLDNVLTLKINDNNTQYFNTASYNITTEGSISHFPFDGYSGSALFGAQSVTNLTDNSTLPCELALDEAGAGSAPDSIREYPLFFGMGQDLDGLTAKTSLDLRPRVPNEFPFDQTVLLSATVHRRNVIKLFAVLMFITVWLVTLSVVIATMVVLLRGRKGDIFNVVAAATALLFALPSLRSATPGIPTTPTISDAVGYFWQIALLAGSIFILLCYWILINLKLGGQRTADPQEERQQVTTHDKAA